MNFVLWWQSTKAKIRKWFWLTVIKRVGNKPLKESHKQLAFLLAALGFSITFLMGNAMLVLLLLVQLDRPTWIAFWIMVGSGTLGISAAFVEILERAKEEFKTK